MIDADRLDELETLAPPDGWPADAQLPPVLTVGDLRDLLALVPLARAAIEWADGRSDDEATVRALLHAVRHARDA